MINNCSDGFMEENVSENNSSFVNGFMFNESIKFRKLFRANCAFSDVIELVYARFNILIKCLRYNGLNLWRFEMDWISFKSKGVNEC